MGKATGKDEAAGKATLVALHGVDWARKQLRGLVGQAHELLEPYGERAAMLKSAASFVARAPQVTHLSRAHVAKS